MDWTKQTEEMIKTWTDAQRKMWDSWMGAMKSGDASGAWAQTVEPWQKAVEQALEAQVAWIRSVAESVPSAPGATKEMSEWSQQMLEMMQRWTEAQKPMWERWFETLKSANVMDMAGTGAEEAKKVAQAWQDAAKKALEAQQEWARRWTGKKSD